MRNLTDEEQKAIKPHFDKIAAQYTKLGRCTTTQELKKELIELTVLAEEQPK